MRSYWFFFFQAEDGIRDADVTGVQTCALPIFAGGPACVVRPRSTAEVAAAVRAAQRLGVAIVPYGAGSGVVGGATPPDRSLVIDLSAMNALLEVHDTALYARAQGGLLGGAYEAAVRGRGYTGGHYPQS